MVILQIFLNTVVLILSLIGMSTIFWNKEIVVFEYRNNKKINKGNIIIVISSFVILIIALSLLIFQIT